MTKFPLSNELIIKAGWVDVGSRIDSKWEGVEVFIDRFKTSFQQLPVDKGYDKFCDYQTLRDECFGDDMLKEAKVIDGEEDGEVLFHYRVDVLCWHVAKLFIPGTAAKRFKPLPKVAGLVLALPHSNAGEERLFSIVRKNREHSIDEAGGYTVKFAGHEGAVSRADCTMPQMESNRRTIGQFQKGSDCMCSL